MNGSFDKSGDGIVRSIYRDWGIGVFALPVLIVIALVGMAMSYQGTANWISDAAQAEFVGTDLAPDVAPAKLAQPEKQIRTVKAN